MRIRNKATEPRHQYTLNNDRKGYFYNSIVRYILFRNKN